VKNNECYIVAKWNFNYQMITKNFEMSRYVEFCNKYINIISNTSIFFQVHKNCYSGTYIYEAPPLN